MYIYSYNESILRNIIILIYFVYIYIYIYYILISVFFVQIWVFLQIEHEIELTIDRPMEITSTKHWVGLPKCLTIKRNLRPKIPESIRFFPTRKRWEMQLVALNPASIPWSATHTSALEPSSSRLLSSAQVIFYFLFFYTFVRIQSLT